MDRRWVELAEILVGYATSVQPGERILIHMLEVETMPLVQALYTAAVQAGAYVQVLFGSEKLKRSLLSEGNLEQASWVPELEAVAMDWADVYFGLRGGFNLYELADIPAEKLSIHQRSLGRISSLRWEKTRWCLVRVPTEALAQQARTDGETLTEMFFQACLRDWSSESQVWRRIAGRLEQGSQVNITGPGTDLHFSVTGRHWCVGDGHLNLPDGEIYTAPIVDSLEGCFTFNLPGVFGGRLVENIRLAWSQGQLVSAEASSNQEFLHMILSTDPGASKIGEFGFGVNPAIDRFCHDILYDEKMGGTLHLAMGRAYPECGGDNYSAIHWDLVHDLRRSGEVFLDGTPVFQQGRFLFA